MSVTTMMKNRMLPLLLTSYGLLPTSASAVELITSVTDGGGRRAQSANYTMDGSFAGVSGISSAPAPEQVARHGYIGQLTDVVALNLTAAPAPVEEEASTQLSGLAVNDDLTVTVAFGSDVHWAAPSWPLASIDAAGLATADAVYEDTLAFYSGAFLGFAGTGAVMVLDVDPDNFGSYAGDGLPDSWQIEFFGFDNPDAAPDADPTGTGQNNWFRYIAGLNPTNAAELFTFRIAAVPDEPDHRDLLYDPVRTGRVYTLRYSTDLPAGVWVDLTSISAPVTNAQEVTVTDVEAMEPWKSYKIRISLP